MPITKYTTAAIVCLVLLRLSIGWQFYNEGVKKLEPGFSSVGFLRGATGPLAPMYHGIVTGPHGAFRLLNQPQEYGSRASADQADLDAWLVDYARRSQAALKSDEPLPVDVDVMAPSYAWFAEIKKDWGHAFDRLGRLAGVEDSLLDRAEQIKQSKLGEIASYLHSENETIEELQHEAWRQEQLVAKAGGSPPPFQQDLIRAKSAEVWRAMQPLASAVESIEQDMIDGVTAAALEAGVSEVRVRHALAERSLLGMVDFLVTWTVIGVGVCVFFGFLTRPAAIVGALFLLSVMATQPLWVADAKTDYFFYQLVEVMAFLVLAATGAGRWAGIDGVFLGIRRSIGDLAPAKTNNPSPEAA